MSIDILATVMPYTLRVKQETIFKTSANQALELSEDQKYSATPSELPVASYAVASGNHLKVTLGKDAEGKQIAFKGKNTWFVFAGHVELLKDGKPVTPFKSPATSTQSFMLMKDSGRRDQFGAKLFNLTWMKDGKPVDSVLVISGSPGLNPIPKSQDYSGSMRPCPEGRFKLGEVEEGYFGSAIGGAWISVHGTNPRQAIGIHEDANRSWSPGSAGCVCPLNASDMNRVAAWREAGAATLVVDHGFKTVVY